MTFRAGSAVPRPKGQSAEALFAWANELCGVLDLHLAAIEGDSVERQRAAREPFMVDNLSAPRRTIDASAATLAETREFLSTLAQDMGRRRILRARRA